MLECIRDVMVVLVTCKNEDAPIQRVATRLYVDFSDSQGQRIP